MKLFIIYATCASVLLGDFLPLTSHMGTKEKVVYLALIATGLAALTLNAVGVQVPSIALAFQEAFTSLFGEL